MPVLIAAVTLLGLAVGSFLNVVIYRVPRGESLSHPGSHCPACDTAVLARHNVPVFGWLILRGHCAGCATWISPRYPLVEALTGALFAATALELARLNLLLALPAYLFFVAVGIALAFIDVSFQRLPNVIVYPAYLVLVSLLAAGATADGDLQPMVRAGLGGLALFVLFLSLALITPQGMGMGDVKLAGLIGLALGYLSYSAVLVGLLAACLVGGAIGVAALAAHRAGPRTPVAFGPALIAGALLALFATAPLVHVYLSLGRTS